MGGAGLGIGHGGVVRVALEDFVALGLVGLGRKLKLLFLGFPEVGLGPVGQDVQALDALFILLTGRGELVCFR